MRGVCENAHVTLLDFLFAAFTFLFAAITFQLFAAFFFYFQSSFFCLQHVFYVQRSLFFFAATVFCLLRFFFFAASALWAIVHFTLSCYSRKLFEDWLCHHCKQSRYFDMIQCESYWHQFDWQDVFLVCFVYSLFQVQWSCQKLPSKINPRLSSLRCCAKTDEVPDEWIYPSCEQLPRKSVSHDKNSLD